MAHEHVTMGSMSREHKRRNSLLKHFFINAFLIGASLCIILGSAAVFWVSTLDLPDFNNFENRNVANSTKIYDRTGKIVLYDVFKNVKRTEVPIEEISPYIRQATISIEDAHFYEHYGFRPQSFIRAAIANSLSGSYSQGGSTITQQVIKNALLTREKSISRKLKEIVLAIKLDHQLPKDEILSIYLNESPYGGTIYGVEEASETYFGKHAKDVSITEAAYLAALPQSPTYYSPYGSHRDALEKRKNTVLMRMHELGYITEDEMTKSEQEVIAFTSPNISDGTGLHFVFYVRDYLEQKYGEDAVLNGGLRVITTLDYNLQKNLEDIVKVGALDNAKVNNASNSALVAIDPRTGQILSMVGSRDFFDKTIDGQFNVATAPRQPGSSFKPIVYSAAFIKGFTPETVLFDVKTQFNSRCDAYGNPLGNAKKTDCYMPENYDSLFRGPVSLREALSQSLNIPAVKLLYLVGIDNAITLAQKMGLSTITDPARYGLSLVLGGGEVTLLELTNAYGVFASNGIYNKPNPILEVRDADNVVLESYTPNQTQVLPENVTALISNVLSDDVARTPSYGAHSNLYFADRPVAVKTGTTNDYRDLWVVGYTPSIVIGIWAGNNDNTSVKKKVAGQILAPIWHKAMAAALTNTPVEYFPEPLPNTSTKPILRGEYCSNLPIKTILTYVDKNDPAGPAPSDPTNDPQYYLWQTGIDNYLKTHPLCGQITMPIETTTTLPISPVTPTQ